MLAIIYAQQKVEIKLQQKASDNRRQRMKSKTTRKRGVSIVQDATQLSAFTVLQQNTEKNIHVRRDQTRGHDIRLNQRRISEKPRQKPTARKTSCELKKATNNKKSKSWRAVELRQTFAWNKRTGIRVKQHVIRIQKGLQRKTKRRRTPALNCSNILTQLMCSCSRLKRKVQASHSARRRV